jgi:hypothetical protein
MKTKFWALPLVAALAACNKAPANNFAANGAPPANGPVAAAPLANGPAAGGSEQAIPAGLDCGRNKLSPEERRAFAQLAAEQGSRDDPRAQPLLRAVDACASELSWSADKKRVATMFSMSAAGATALREELIGQGLSLDQLDQAIQSDQEFMAAAAAGQLAGGTAGQEFAMRHAALIQQLMGDRAEDQQLAERIGNYIAFRALALTLANQFGQQP